MDLDLDITCPDCGSPLRATLDDVARERTVRCGRGHSINLRDEGGGARSATKSLSDLERTLKRLGR